MSQNECAVRIMLGFVFTFCAVSAGAQVAFEADQQAAAAKNPPGVTCTLRLPEGKTSFHQGEIIPVEVQFTSDRPGVYRLDRFMLPRPRVENFGSFRAAPGETAHDPLQELRPQYGGFSGYMPEPVLLSTTPISLNMELNDWVRFDAPGTYRVYAISHCILDAATPAVTGSAAFFSLAGSGSQAVSNILQLTILPQDDAWSHAQVETAMAQLAPFDGRYMGEQDAEPAHVLRALGTKEAARAMIERLGKDERPRSFPVESQQYYTGLVGFTDRVWLVKEMESALSRPDYAVTQPFLDDLTLLAGLLRAGRPPAKSPPIGIGAPQMAVEHPEGGTLVLAPSYYWFQAADVVPLKTGRAKAMTLDTLLESAWLDGSIARDSFVQNRVPPLRTALVSMFDDLPPTPQEYMLRDLWGRVKGPDFVPSLLRLWERLEPPLPGYSLDLADLVLRRINELTPSDGKTIILQQIASEHPKVSIRSLKLLPVKTMPSLDPQFAAKLNSKLTRTDLTADLIERYATSAILPSVRAYYEEASNRSYQTNVALLAYFFRVDPTYGERMLQALLTQGKMNGDIWTELARRHFDPSMARIALQHLNDPDLFEAMSAAKMLSEYGSPRAKTALLERLRRTEDSASRRSVEWALVQALGNGKAWLLDVPELTAIRALCTTISGQSIADTYLGARIQNKIYVNYEFGEPDHWNIARSDGEGFQALIAKLAQYPRGTVFSWQTTGFNPDEASVFKQAQAFVHAQRMTLERYTIDTTIPG